VRFPKVAKDALPPPQIVPLDAALPGRPVRLGVWMRSNGGFRLSATVRDADVNIADKKTHTTWTIGPLQLDGGDFLARLYLGLISLRESTPQTTAKGDNSFGVNEILYALKEKVSPRRLAALVKERGANFELTAELEKELRRAGADDELVGQVRASSRLRANVAPIQPGVREIERALKEIQSWQVGVRKTDVGRTWDSRKQISSRVDTGLSLISIRRTDRPEFVAALEPLGRVIDEEVDLTRSK
jgi:hypothetical protein